MDFHYVSLLDIASQHADVLRDKPHKDTILFSRWLQPKLMPLHNFDYQNLLDHYIAFILESLLLPGVS